MNMIELLTPWLDIASAFNCEVTGLSLDSRKINSGEIFIALVGTHTDGRQFISQAIEKGAVAIIAEGDEIKIAWYENKKIPHITFSNLNQLYGHIAARFYDYPSRDLQVIGVTGTNGKTSTTHFIAQVLTRLDKPCAVMGTVGNGPLNNLQKSLNTTPDAITIQKFLSEMREQGFHSVAMEVASHALEQYRVNGVEFAAGVLTNLTQDHLDYHGTMENYAAAKKKLFTEFQPKVCVLNADDDYGERWLNEAISPLIKGGGRDLITFAYTAKEKIIFNSQQIPCVSANHATFTQTGITARINSPWGDGGFTTPLIGQFNLSNILAVITTLCAMGEDFHNVLKQLPYLASVKGRMQLITLPNKPKVIVDYSHTPDSLEKALQTLKAYHPKQLWCVFGCGGDRDKTKRSIMGKMASVYADKIILTDDNIRTEKSADIINDIIAGISPEANYGIKADRAEAIAYAIQQANQDDIILIAGKGHEDYQEINGVRHYFSDIEEVMKGLRNRVGQA